MEQRRHTHRDETVAHSENVGEAVQRRRLVANDLLLLRVVERVDAADVRHGDGRRAHCNETRMKDTVSIR